MADPVTLLILAVGGLQAASAIQEWRIAKGQRAFNQKITLRPQESLHRQAKAEEDASR